MTRTKRILIVAPPGGVALIQARYWPYFAPFGVGDLDQLEASLVHQAARLLTDDQLLSSRPFRAPHHTVSLAGLVGGGATRVHPGEASLAHGGTLVLDQITEFRSDALEALFSVLDEGRVSIGRSGERFTFPAAPALVIGIACATEKPERIAKVLPYFHATLAP
jgi:magnesium chelatase family protein